MLDIHALHVFIIAAKTLNFTHAAQQLHLTQPSVSQHIQVLERHFGQELFHRSGRNLELTDAGRTLIPLAQQAVELSLNTDHTMEALKGQVYGHLLVVCSTTPGKYVLPQILANFHRLYPLVTLACNVAGQLDALRTLAAGESHFALFSLEYRDYPEIDAFPFLTDPIVLIAPRNHPWAKAGRISIQDLLHGDYIMRESHSGTYDAVAMTLAKHGVIIDDINIFITLGNAEAVALSVAEGIGVGFVSKMVVDRICRDKVTEVEIEGVKILRQIFIGRNRLRPKAIAQEKFWQYLQEESSKGTLFKSEAGAA